MAHTPFNSWLWPDHAIGKRASRVLREEHNALVDSHAELLEACRAIVAADLPSSNGTVESRRANAIQIIARAITKAEGRE